MFITFEQLTAAAKKVAKKVGTTCHIQRDSNSISFAPDKYSKAYLGITYSQDMKAAYNTFSSFGETTITSRDQLEHMLRQEVAVGI